MPAYAAPIDDMRFVLSELCELEGLAALPAFAEVAPDMVDQILAEAGRFTGEVLAPMNQPGDQTGSHMANGGVVTPAGFKEAYAQFVEGGWNSMPFDPAIGGMGLPWALATAVQEMWQSANLSWSLCPLLTIGAIEALNAHGDEALRAAYLAKLVSGEWTGTMNLTEPQAGSDLNLLKSRAVREGGHYRITGQKIFITFGEHDMAENIIHLVLARLPDAPAGTRGISLFLVPKFLVGDDGSVGAPNDVRCVSVEHKLGIHASPTCVMSYGDEGGTIGYLIGAENEGLRCMFTMMNTARLNVGLQGVAVAERAYQQAVEFARERVQSTPLAGGDGPIAIIGHPDVRRMLMAMRAQTEAMRALAYYANACLDRAHHGTDADDRRRQFARMDLLTPVVKAWCTDTGVDIASIGIQVHGGMGYVEETGAAQYLRDARIAPIYEGTNGIQANDLLGRKLLRDNGGAMADLLDDIAALDAELAAAKGEDMAAIRAALADGHAALQRATDWLLDSKINDLDVKFAGAVPFLHLTGTVVGGWLMARGALAAHAGAPNGASAGFRAAKLITARFYAEHVMVRARGYLAAITDGAGSVLALPEDQF